MNNSMLTHKPIGKVITLPNLSIKYSPFDKLALTVDRTIILIDVNSISHFESDSNYTKLWLANGTKILSSKTLKRFEDRINNQQFLRIHNSFIINTEQIASFDTSENQIEMRNGNLIPVSRARKQLLMQYLKTIMV